MNYSTPTEKFEKFKEWIDIGNEIEFTYKGEEYSVTYSAKENGKTLISFCKFYCEPCEFASADDFMKNAKIDDEYLKDIWDKVVDIYIY
ncbi:MAG: hypothetical protein K1V95_00980 [Eubacterium sp.]